MFQKYLFNTADSQGTIIFEKELEENNGDFDAAFDKIPSNSLYMNSIRTYVGDEHFGSSSFNSFNVPVLGSVNDWTLFSSVLVQKPNKYKIILTYTRSVSNLGIFFKESVKSIEILKKWDHAMFHEWTHPT